MNGYSYTSEYDKDDDVTKIFHYVITPQGERNPINWSSYEDMSNEDFKLWIYLGMPARPLKGTNFRHDTLIDYLNHTMAA